MVRVPLACLSRVGALLLLLLAVACGAAAGRPAAAEDAAGPEALAYCERAERNLNALVEKTVTSCRPLRLQGEGPVSFLFLASGAVLESEGARRDWLVPLVTVTGFLLNSGALDADRILISDSRLAGRKKAFSLPAASVRRLQRSLADKTLDPETMYARVLAELDVDQLD